MHQTKPRKGHSPVAWLLGRPTSAGQRRATKVVLFVRIFLEIRVSSQNLWLFSKSTGVGGVLTTPDSVTNPEAPKKMLGSTLIFEAESIEECVRVRNPLLLAFFIYSRRVKKAVEGDIYYTSGVVCSRCLER